jgi:threonine dehydrogenase-like Zn-dependent dehydrogenase
MANTQPLDQSYQHDIEKLQQQQQQQQQHEEDTADQTHEHDSIRLLHFLQSLHGSFKIAEQPTTVQRNGVRVVVIGAGPVGLAHSLAAYAQGWCTKYQTSAHTQE